MKPIFQTKFGGAEAPEEEQGNCMAACLASIFEVGLEEVPDFAGNIANGKWFEIAQEWLAQRNLSLWCTEMKYPPRGIHIRDVKSTTLANPDDGHVVVCEDGNVVHDPNPRSKGVGATVGYWAFVVLDPSKQEHVHG